MDNAQGWNEAINHFTQSPPLNQTQSDHLSSQMTSGSDFVINKILMPFSHLMAEAVGKYFSAISKGNSVTSPLVFHAPSIPTELQAKLNTTLANIEVTTEKTITDLLTTLVEGLGAAMSPATMSNTLITSIGKVGDDVFKEFEAFTQLFSELTNPDNLLELFDALFCQSNFVTLQIPLLTDFIKILGLDLSLNISFSELFSWTTGLGVWLRTYAVDGKSLKSMNELTSSRLHQSNSLLGEEPLSLHETWSAMEMLMNLEANIAWSLDNPAQEVQLTASEPGTSLQEKFEVFNGLSYIVMSTLEYFAWGIESSGDASKDNYGYITMMLENVITLFQSIISMASGTKEKESLTQALDILYALLTASDVIAGLYFLFKDNAKSKELVEEIGNDIYRFDTFCKFTFEGNDVLPFPAARRIYLGLSPIVSFILETASS